MADERILIADDEVDVLDLCQRILSSEGYRVITVNGGEEAIQAARRNDFDLFLTDIKMPGRNGLEISRAVKTINPNIICMVMTGFATKETAIEALKLGIDEFVVKPFSPEELSLAVSKVLEKERLRQENSRLRALLPLFELNRLIMSTLTRSALLEEIVVIARQELKADFAALYLLEADGDVSCHIQKHDVGSAAGKLLQTSQALAEQVVLSREQALISVEKSHVNGYVAGWSMVANPLVAKEKFLGILVLSRCEADFSPGDKDFLAVMSGQASIALENAGLFEEIQQAYEELKTLDHMKSEFINIAAHELRTPLAILMGYANILEDSVDGENQGYVNIIVRNAMRLRALIDDILNMRYIQTGETRIKLGPIRLNEIVSATVEDMELLAQEKSVTISSGIPQDFPTLYADKQKLELILANLLSNAIKFTSEGGQVTIGAEVRERMAYISVTDTGIGIPPGEIDKIFDRFYQVEESLTREYGGLGLGLSITKGWVEICGGSIWVDSSPGEGSTFTFSVPLESGAGPQEAD
ncbi:MAG: ATP-binding protein [Anaerolineae bacterium]